jgi:hypothetical protein
MNPKAHYPVYKGQPLICIESFSKLKTYRPERNRLYFFEAGEIYRVLCSTIQMVTISHDGDHLDVEKAHFRPLTFIEGIKYFFKHFFTSYSILPC